MDKIKFRRYKRTAVITLVLIASVGLEACASYHKRREVYRNLQDCHQQWGEANLCEPITDGSYPVGYHYGPYYKNRGGRYYYYRTFNSSPRAVPSSAGISNTTRGGRSPSVGGVRRGGFGSGGRSATFRGTGGSRGG
ncbi:hypothetical protein B9T07_23310 [Limnospira fusiformis CCALA 023]|uniref:hypothetical protein n=1 Tax=Oscillatoriales TaxID=1150 RepID=UPI0012CD2034|nr:hypothetical protein [Arthrospira sp. PLM2.Bin9]TVU53822.1 MAG: hypothetical protein EA414_10290 [Arthrospira sp. PLM2.Bin9]